MEENDGPADGDRNEPDGGGGGDGWEGRNIVEIGGEEEPFDISLAALHSYMGAGLKAVRGRCVLEAGWEGRVPVVAHHGAVFPGETVPMLLQNSQDVAMLTRTLEKDKLFGLLCPDETGTMVSGYGVLCEVFEAGEEEQAPASGLPFKARARHRFRLLDAPKQSVPLYVYTRMRMADVVVLPEVAPGDPLRMARLPRRMDAAATPWPLFVYDMFQYERMRSVIRDHFRMQLMNRLPADPVSLSFWTASNLALSARDRLALLVVDNALLRLHMEVRMIQSEGALCCGACAAEVTRRRSMFAMSSEGVHSNYTNLGGFVHDVVTVADAEVSLSGAPSEEYSWFPGYAWTVALCWSCGAHVGWRFDASSPRTLRPSQFFALCRDRVQPRAPLDH